MKRFEIGTPSADHSVYFVDKDGNVTGPVDVGFDSTFTSLLVITIPPNTVQYWVVPVDSGNPSAPTEAPIAMGTVELSNSAIRSYATEIRQNA
jgi:hypothetical protein